MKLKLIREPSAEGATLGKLYIDGEYFCETLEDVVRVEKIAGITAIPIGEYKIIINMSNRFKQLMPLLLAVPNFDGSRIHWGNTAENTEGCILVGKVRLNATSIGRSREAFSELMKKISGEKNLSIEIC